MDQLQKQALKAFTNLQKCLQKRLKPLITPAILDQPATLLEEEGNNKKKKKKKKTKKQTKRSCMPSISSLKSTLDIVASLEETLDQMERHKIFPIVIKQFFVQTFYLIGAQTFNQMMEEPRYCSYTNAFQIKFAIAQLLSWASSKSRTLAFSKTR